MFSVIMPVYNNKQSLGAAVESVLEQTISDLELIIVDDGSTDGSYERSLEFAAKDERVRVFQNSHGGVSSARNRGIEEARGDTLVFIDSDDFWEKDLIKHGENIPHGTYRIFGYKTERFHSGEMPISITNEFGTEGVEAFDLSDLSPDELLHYNIAAPWNKFFEKNIIEENQIRFNTQCVYLEDLTFNLEYLRYCHSVEVLHNNLYHYRVDIDKKQILKRNFKEPFKNADALFYASKDFLSALRKDFLDTERLRGTLIAAYCREALSWMHGKRCRDANVYLRQLNNNANFRHLLFESNGRFLKILRLAIKCNILPIEKRMLKKRYW